MPRVQWTNRQILELRHIAIELIRLMDNGGDLGRFINETWDAWVAFSGPPIPVDWNDVQDYSQFVVNYRWEVFRWVRWYAFRARLPPSNHRARVRRMAEIRRSIRDDSRLLAIRGINLDDVRDPSFESNVSDEIRGSYVSVRSNTYVSLR
ncbi:hypothetical protein NMY22_g525 [Coprinellus aureogranulatus]|nr:hypothetical protein NMY22_g525 [Coprinellus aureogranulatus]